MTSALIGLALPVVLLVALVVRRVAAGVRASVSMGPARRRRPLSKSERRNRREWWEIAGVLCFIPLTFLIINPLLALFLVWAFRLPDKGFVTDVGVQYWVAATFPAVMSATGLGLYARLGDETVPESGKGGWGWLIFFSFPLIWTISLNGSQFTDYTPSDISVRLGISTFQAEFLQATAEPAMFVFLVSFLSMYAVMLANGESLSSYPVPLEKRRPRPSRRVRVTVIVAVYVVMAVVFVFVGRSAGDRYW